MVPREVIHKNITYNSTIYRKCLDMFYSVGLIILFNHLCVKLNNTMLPNCVSFLLKLRKNNQKSLTLVTGTFTRKTFLLAV